MLIDWIAKRFRKSAQPECEVTSSADWCAHFAANEQSPDAIPWDKVNVTPEELAEIVASLRGWQLGETSEGNHLRAAARKYADASGDVDFLAAVERFIAEEQRHGETLGRWLDHVGVARAQKNWGDTLFRWSRYFLSNMEAWTTPVVMIETHALVYYNAIRLATNCPVLRQICAGLLADEIPHIRFQCERLAMLHKDRPRWLYALTMLLHRVFFTGITLIVWVGHRRALRAGGYGFGRFWRSAWAKMDHAWRLMDPRGYRWPAASIADAGAERDAQQAEVAVGV